MFARVDLMYSDIVRYLENFDGQEVRQPACRPASLLEEIGKSNFSSSSDLSQFYFLQSCLGMDTDLDIWYDDFRGRESRSESWPSWHLKMLI